jgi:hypothetical protein
MKAVRRTLLLLTAIVLASGFGAAAPEPEASAAHDPHGPDAAAGPEWAQGLSPEEARLVLAMQIERLQALAAVPLGRDSLRLSRDVQRRFEEKLAEILTPEALSLYRATLPSALAVDEAGAKADAGELCGDGYTELERACSSAVIARDQAKKDNDEHGEHNSLSHLEYDTSAWVKKYSCEARDIAAVARTDCFAADDAAERAALGILAAQQQFEQAVDAASRCFFRYDHNNHYADEAASAALSARNWLLSGQDSENACYDCCTKDAEAPGGIDAFAQSASQVRLTWQDRSAETHFEIQRSSNGGGYVTFATVTTDIEAATDTAGSGEANLRYRVRALHTGCEIQGPWSTLAVVPKAPANLTYTRAGDKITLNWNDRSPLEMNFEIHRRLGSQGWSLFLTVPANTESKPNVLLEPGVNRFRVRAKTPSGKSWYTNEFSVTK